MSYDRIMHENPEFIKSMKDLLIDDIKSEQASLSKFANETHSSMAEWYNFGHTRHANMKKDLCQKFIPVYEEVNS